MSSTPRHHQAQDQGFPRAETAAAAQRTPLLYPSLARVPLVKSPALRVPPPVSYPTSIHPLPDSISDYFVYPYHLETVVLRQRDRREQERREHLRRLAPGWDEAKRGSILVPTTRSSNNHQAATPTHASTPSSSGQSFPAQPATSQQDVNQHADSQQLQELLHDFGSLSTSHRP